MARQRCLYFLAFVLLLIMPLARADDYAGTITFSPQDLQIQTTNGRHFIHLEGGVPIGPAGMPALPAVERDIAVPWDAEGIDVRLLVIEVQEMDGVFDVAPMTRPQIISGQGVQEEPFVKDPLVYERDAAYPGIHVELLAEWTLVGQRFSKLRFHPVQYNPGTGKLTLATRIEFIVTWQQDRAPAPKPAFNLTPAGRDDYLGMMRRNTLNPDQICLPPYPGNGSMALPPGQYEHVIITPQSFESEWDVLVQWHTLKGLPDIVVTKEYIYTNYSGSTNMERIRNFVIDAHSTWGARYFLIGADGGGGSTQIPYHERYLLSEYVPNDTYYADYNTDWVVDVHMGRASVTSATEIEQFIDKVLYYEQTPPSSPYGKEVFFMGFDLDSKTPGEDTMELIKNNDIPAYINYHREYDSESGAHLSDVTAFLNDGPNLVNHIDHCNWNVWGMGYTNHGESMYESEVNALTNGWRLINYYTLGCLASAWDYGTSLSEVFMRKVDSGGVSFTGNTRYGWYAVGYEDLYSSLYDIRWWHVLFTDNVYHVGETLTEHKNDYYPDDEYYQYIFTELNLLGDPAMPLWKDDPSSLTVTCDDPAYTGSQSYLVNVTQDASPVEEALVCLSKDTEVYEYGLTDSSGDASFTIDPATEGLMQVTVTAQNGLPHLGTVTVSESAPPEVTGVAPGHGGVSGGTACTVSGHHFTTSADTTVSFGGSAAGNVAVLDSNTLTCESPAHAAGIVDVTVTTSNGSDTLAGAFTYHDAPQITSLDPDHGPMTGGTLVTLMGSNFTQTGSTSVTFDSTSATGITVVNDTTITCTTPAHAPDFVDVVVTNDFGSDTLANGYGYDSPPPGISNVSPAHGPSAGGTAVTVTGSNFTLDTEVTFGGEAASNIVYVNFSTLTCDSPAHASGLVDVTVSDLNGSDTLLNAFTYHDPPQIFSLDPGNGPMMGGTFVTLTGSDFTDMGSTTVTFGGDSAAGVVVVDASTITCTTPAHAPGDVDVVVTNDFGFDTLTSGFAYNFPPEILGVSPAHGPVAGGTAMTVTGNYFTADTEVAFGSITALDMVVVDSTTLTCTTPAHAAGIVDVEVDNLNGSDLLPSCFVFHEAPTIQSVSPDHGPAAGGASVTITGKDLTYMNMEVFFGGEPAGDIVVVNTTTLTCTTPPYAKADIIDVEVSNPYGSDTLKDAYFYLPASGADPLNLTDVDTLDLQPNDMVLHAVTGAPGSLYMLFLSFGPGPVNSPWGAAGLDMPIYYLYMSTIGVEGYSTVNLKMPNTGSGFINFYTQALVDNAPPIWAKGGNNPNGTGSIMWGLN